MNKILNIAHRGAPAFAPENTLESFQKAIEFGADMVELDVRKSKDGKLVVIHDKKVDRVTDGKGRVDEMTLAELKQLKIRGKSEIPALEEVFELARGKVGLDIEIKIEGIEKEVLDRIYRFSIQDKVIITSFWPEILKKIRELDKKIKIGIINHDPRCYGFRFWNYFNPISFAKEIKANFIIVSLLLANKYFIAKAKKAGFPVYVFIWRGNNEKTMRRIIARGASGIITNRSDILRNITQMYTDNADLH